MMAVAIIIRVAHKNIRNPTNPLKCIKSTTQFLQRMPQTYYTVTRRQFYNTFDIFFVQIEWFNYTFCQTYLHS